MTGHPLTIQSNRHPKETVSPAHSGPHATEPPCSAANWRDVTRRIIHGDAESFEFFYRQYFPLMLQTAYRLSGRDESTCLDLVHEAMLKAIRSMKSIGDPSMMTAWTQAVIKSTVYDWLRKNHREQNTFQQLDQKVHALESCDDDSVHSQARLAWVENQLQNLEPQLRHIVRLRYRWGWTLAKIAGHMGLKTGAVDGRISRAIEKLKQQAEREFHE